jgi:hypothetical protein
MGKERERLSIQPNRAGVSVVLPRRKRSARSPSERRPLIGEKVLIGASKRIRVGGHPLTDRVYAETELNADYVTNDRGDCSSAVTPSRTPTPFGNRDLRAWTQMPIAPEAEAQHAVLAISSLIND